MKDQQGEVTVEKMCRVLGVGRSGFYDWLNRSPSRRSEENRLIKEEIHTLYHRSKGRYGSPKITMELRDDVAVARHSLA